MLSIQAKDSATVNRLSSVIQVTHLLFGTQYIYVQQSYVVFLMVMQLNVIVDDVNDNDPVFIEQDIFITVGEGEDLGEVLVQGRLASDIDSGTNGQITYSLLSDEGMTDYF